MQFKPVIELNYSLDIVIRVDHAQDSHYDGSDPREASNDPGDSCSRSLPAMPTWQNAGYCHRKTSKGG